MRRQALSSSLQSKAEAFSSCDKLSSDKNLDIGIGSREVVQSVESRNPEPALYAEIMAFGCSSLYNPGCH